MTGHIDEAARDAFVERLFVGGVHMMEVMSIYLGDRLGLYRSLAGDGTATTAELAARTGIHERYAREWLEQQAAAGILSVDDPAKDPAERSFSLPREHAEALIDLDSPYSMTPLGRSVVACAKVLPALLEAYRTGRGVDWADYGDDMIEAQGDFNRPWLKASLGSEYLPKIADVHGRLLADPPARVADVACGVGWAAIAIAQAYPKVRVDGFDLDVSSIELASSNAATAGLDGRVRFEARDAADPVHAGQYDLVIMIEALHDLAHPVEVLRAMKAMTASGGAVIVADEMTADRFTAPTNEVERLFYGFSILCCLPAAMVEQPSAATGTVMRESTLRSYAAEAGFASVEVLDLGHELLRFYRLGA
jgi:2-polyprenyl-3-methyl-5-hydroxy-6-metoxy-1,4-benzoquinol methylase